MRDWNGLWKGEAKALSIGVIVMLCTKYQDVIPSESSFKHPEGIRGYAITQQFKQLKQNMRSIPPHKSLRTETYD